MILEKVKLEEKGNWMVYSEMGIKKMFKTFDTCNGMHSMHMSKIGW